MVADQFCGACVPQVTVPVKVSGAGKPLGDKPVIFLLTVTGALVLKIWKLTELLLDDATGSDTPAGTAA